MERNGHEYRDRFGLLMVLTVGLAVAATVSYAVTSRPVRKVSPMIPISFPAAMTAEEESQASFIDRGRYLVRTSGCNDCHTPGFNVKGEGVPESEWLTGVPMGWNGPWGTTYAPNLRLTFKDMKLADWILIARSRNERPPMPWANLHAMTDEDLASIYHYVRSMPANGDRMPDGLPPGEMPKTAYVDLMPKLPDDLPNHAALTQP